MASSRDTLTRCSPSGEIFREVPETPPCEPPAFLPTSPSHQTRNAKRSADVPELTWAVHIRSEHRARGASSTTSVIARNLSS